MKQITLITNDLQTGVTIFPKEVTGNLRTHRWNRRDVGKHEEKLNITSGDTLFFVNDNWYHIVENKGKLVCYDISDGMLGVELFRGTTEELNIIRKAIHHCSVRINVYPYGEIKDGRLEITFAGA